MKYCKFCGTEVKDNQAFCTHCGANLAKQVEEVKIETVDETKSNDVIIEEVGDTLNDATPNNVAVVAEEEPTKGGKKKKVKKPQSKGARVAGNIFWLLLGGLIWGIGLGITAIGCFVSVIGIPAGFQYMKICKFVFSPFGKEVYVVKKGFWRTLANVFWCISLGLINWLAFILFGVLLCITIIGIPFAKQYFKLAKFIIWPYGRDFRIATK